MLVLNNVKLQSWVENFFSDCFRARNRCPNNNLWTQMHMALIICTRKISIMQLHQLMRYSSNMTMISVLIGH
jgi:hypothetical protein